MNFKIKGRKPRQNYSTMDLSYVGNGVELNSNQRRRLIEIYHQNIQDRDELESKISELDNLSAEEGDQILWDFEMCSFNTVR